MATRTATRSKQRSSIRRALSGDAVIRALVGSALRTRRDVISAVPRAVHGDEPNRPAADAAVLDVFLAFAPARIREGIDPLAAMRALDFVVRRIRSHPRRTSRRGKIRTRTLAS